MFLNFLTLLALHVAEFLYKHVLPILSLVVLVLIAPPRAQNLVDALMCPADNMPP